MKKKSVRMSTPQVFKSIFEKLMPLTVKVKSMNACYFLVMQTIIIQYGVKDKSLFIISNQPQKPTTIESISFFHAGIYLMFFHFNIIKQTFIIPM